MRRPILTAAAPACLLLGLSPVSAAADVAPESTATATAASVSNLAKVSSTAAKADNTKADAKAAVISVGDQPVLGTGGSQASEGETGGALIDTGSDKGSDDAPRVRVAPWKAKATGTKASGKRSSSASAALAEVSVPNAAKVGLLTSDATAEHTNEKSTGMSTSNAADISVGDNLRLVLLHSEVNSSANGSSYLVSLNGTTIGDQEQLKELCSLDVSGVAAVSCLTASGGTANGITSGAAEVLGVQTALPLLNPASAFATTGTAGLGSPGVLESVAAAVPAVEAPRAAAAAPPRPAAAELPRTGVAAASLAVSGATGLLGGLALRRLGRRRAKKA